MRSSKTSSKRLVIALGSLFCILLLSRAQDASITAITQNIPVGLENKNASLPSFDVTGQRSSLITAEIIRRIDDERLYAEGFRLEQYGKDEAHDLHIDLSTAHYNMATGTLRSTQRSRVSRADFEIEGDNLIFDTQTNRGLMQGNIRMVIFDNGSN